MEILVTILEIAVILYVVVLLQSNKEDAELKTSAAVISFYISLLVLTLLGVGRIVLRVAESTDYLSAASLLAVVFIGAYLYLYNKKNQA